ncbi:hypothetical protein [Phytohabitans rumicis]|uniref:Uncharacterized protein n=1 Tax=Phytohabitans rumicis TaxID=1076125 RepID=A0A6V8LEP0_9ACTN|nr:hypothetical protein [Phytohabitans rumicis]GFJ94744.1 hypothetical protein Prum_083860 [Phytohabitans rumicis]
MDRPRARHVDRRDQGLRRQRTVTQATAGGAAALAVLFGWAFAQPKEAPAVEPASSTKSPSATKKPATKKPSATKSPAAEQAPDEEATLEPPEQAPEEAPEVAPQEEPDAQSGGS